MTTIDLKQRAAEQLALLEERLTALLAQCERLQAENQALRERQAEPAAGRLAGGGQTASPAKVMAGESDDLENSNAS